MANCIIEEQNLHDIANAIRSKNGTLNQYKPSQMAGAISQIESKEIVSPKNPIIIYDYNGDIIASYTKDQFLALETYPEAPTHEDVVFDEYNWSLSDAKAYLSTHDNLLIGAIYKTTNKETILYLTPDENTPVNLSFYLTGSATIDWGEGSPETITGSGSIATNTKTLTSTPHKIKITPIDSAEIQMCSFSNIGGILSASSESSVRPNKNKLTKIVLGKITMNSGCLREYMGLENIIMTNDVTFTSSHTYCFRDVYSLNHLNVPKNVTVIGSGAFYNCGLETLVYPSTLLTVVDSTFTNSKVRKITIPNSCSTIYTSGFYNAIYLETLELPDSVTNMASDIFNSCYSLKKLSLPTMANFNANYTNLCNHCKNLKEITIPEQYTQICNNMFNDCQSLSYIKVSKNLTAFGTDFMYNSAITTIDCSDILQVPTLSNAPANVVSTYRFIVPDSLYDSWVSASVWSTISTHIVRVSDL